MATTDNNADNQHGGRLHDARDAATRALETTRTKATDALGSSRDVAADAARRAAATLDSNPIGIVVGGLAVGALAGALIPRSAREKELLRPLGQQLGTRARGALQAAREAGQGALDEKGLSKDAAKDQIKGLFDNLVKAASTAGSAAAKSAASGDA